MKTIYAERSATMTELKQSPASVINEAHGDAVVILNRNVPAAYMVPPELFEAMIEALADQQLENVALKRLNKNGERVRVNLDDL
ncbi:antitoxin [Piscirickettsiaceae bacterium NZ-RLO2]|uniref:type II toxin-antitoxin system Phd/YefM family antitoxin n=1 Tax=Piscirickettsia salmonis TaxID=1238 RepID=UPI000F0789F2|nr:antitoxin [Piscirickettsiaceae bacterium NZ-RLO2]